MDRYPARARVYDGRSKNTRGGRRRKPARWWIPAAVALSLALILCLVSALFAALQGGEAGISGPPFVVALDAGHGGNDVGADGIIQEVALTERTVALLYDLLEADPNFTPVLCRDYSSGAKVNDRARVARRNNASMLLSVHGNASEDVSASGFECYPVPPGRDWHEESFRFGQLLGEEMAAAGSTLRGEGGIRYAYYENGSSKVIREASDSSVYEDKSFGVLEGPGCIAVLAEQCFVTNEHDVATFAGEEGCAKAAAAYYRAICRLFDELTGYSSSSAA